MDALYLKENINDAIAEALTSMVVSSPDDPIEYMGQFLINYVDRKIEMNKKQTISASAEISAEAAVKAQEKAFVEKTLKDDAAARHEKKVAQFIEGLPNIATTKAVAYDNVTKFLSEYLNVPSVYIAEKRVVGESEALHYFSSAGSGDISMVGRKLMKPGEPEDPENPPPRQGLSFEAFKIPEAPEEEPVELEEGEEPPPPPPPPKASPLIVDNTMRDTRTKFFGIPKLGSYAAVPFFLNSVEHPEGCVLGPQPEPVEPDPEADPEAPPPEQPEPWPLYVSSKVSLGILIGMDTVGSYRRFTDKEIEIANLVGDALIMTCEKIEGQLFESHLDFMSTNTPLVESVTAIPAALAEQEAAALAAIAEEIGENPIMEQLKASKEADAISEVWTTALTTAPAVTALDAFNSHYLPPVKSVVDLLFGVLSFLGQDTKLYNDLCGDISWAEMRAKGIPELVDSIKTYKHENDECAEYTDATFKTYIETVGLSDPSILPPNMPALSILLTWTQKMMTSREARIVYLAAKAEADAAAEEARLAAEEEARLAAEAEAAAAAEE